MSNTIAKSIFCRLNILKVSSAAGCLPSFQREFIPVYLLRVYCVSCFGRCDVNDRDTLGIRPMMVTMGVLTRGLRQAICRRRGNLLRLLGLG